MAEEMHMKDSTSSRGAQWAGAGSLIAIAAQSLLNGGIGGILGGGNNTGTAAAIELAKKDSEIALLKANSDTDKKLVDVYTQLRVQDKEQDAKIALLREDVHALDKRVGENALIASNGITALNGSVAALANTVAGITKCVVPITSVCPQPMPQYNSWTAPTTPTTAG